MRQSQFLPLALFLAALLLSFFFQYRVKRAENKTRREPGVKAPPVRPSAPSSLLPSHVVSPQATPLPAVSPLVTSHPRFCPHLGSSREVRRGIVLSTILGPCRALEPPEFPPRNHG